MKYNRVKQAEGALKRARNMAESHDDPARQVQTLLRGIATAESWLKGTHPLLLAEAEKQLTLSK